MAGYSLTHMFHCGRLVKSNIEILQVLKLDQVNKNILCKGGERKRQALDKGIKLVIKNKCGQNTYFLDNSCPSIFH